MRDEFKSRRRKREEQRQELKEIVSNTTFEKSDLSALIIAALTTVLPFAVAIFVVIFISAKLILRM